MLILALLASTALATPVHVTPHVTPHVAPHVAPHPAPHVAPHPTVPHPTAPHAAPAEPHMVPPHGPTPTHPEAAPYRPAWRPWPIHVHRQPVADTDADADQPVLEQADAASGCGDGGLWALVAVLCVVIVAALRVVKR